MICPKNKSMQIYLSFARFSPPPPFASPGTLRNTNSKLSRIIHVQCYSGNHRQRNVNITWHFLHSKYTSLNGKNEILEDIVPHSFQQLAVLFSSLSLRGWSKHSIRYQLTSVVCGEDGRKKNSGCKRRIDKKKAELRES
jgi:hypothetical protein